MALIALLLLAALDLGHSASVNVGIVNGSEATPHSRPYMVSIQIPGAHICGGFLVSERFVITAMHCWNGKDRLTAVLGAHDLGDISSSIHMPVETYYAHPSYNPSTFDYDILLLKLKGRAPLGPSIRPISIPGENWEIPANIICSVAGWGNIGDANPGNLRLRESYVRIVGLNQCQMSWGTYVNQLKLCTLHPGGVCGGDSGGPLVCRGYAVGIASFVQTCDKPTSPNVFARVGAFLPWIRSIAGNV